MQCSGIKSWLTSYHQHSPSSRPLSSRFLWTGKGYSTDVDCTVIESQPVYSEGNLVLCQIHKCEFVCLISASIQAQVLGLESAIAKPQACWSLCRAPRGGERALHGHSLLSVVHFKGRWLNHRDGTVARGTCRRKQVSLFSGPLTSLCASVLLTFWGEESLKAIAFFFFPHSQHRQDCKSRHWWQYFIITINGV